MKIVVDTNCLLVSVPRRSQYRWLYDAILKGEVELVVTTEILMEYEEQLGIFYSSDYADYVLHALSNLPTLFKVNPLYYWLLITNKHCLIALVYLADEEVASVQGKG